MESSRFDRLTRRASLMTLGAAGLAGFTALVSPIAAGAKKKGKKNKRKKGDVNALCKVQAVQWTSLVTGACDGNPVCLDALSCASPLGTCDFGSFFACYVAAATT